ncbi:MAG: acetate--CoA ligase family protein [Stellaceae bacterium]
MTTSSPCPRRTPAVGTVRRRSPGCAAAGLANAKAYAPQARIIGVSVQEMIRDGVEVIIGVNCDPQLGPVLLFGSGGVMVEVYNDVALRRCPITRSEGQARIAEVKGARVWGFRGAGGGPPGAPGYPGARVVPRHAPWRTLGRAGHQSAHGATVRPGS